MPLPETKKSMFFASSISCQNALIHHISSEKVLSISFENVLITTRRPVPYSLIFRQLRMIFQVIISLRKIN